MKKLTLSCLGIFLLATLFVTFVSAPSEGVEPIVIGAICHLTGTNAVQGQDMKRGEELVVTAIDKASGLPVPGVEVYARRHPASTIPFVPNIFEAEARTDTEGKARFSNLPSSQVKVGLRGMNVRSADEGIVDPGREKQLVLGGEIPEWSDLRPQPH